MNLLKGLDDAEDRAVARPWLKTPIDTKKVQARLPEIFAIFSDNDPYVPIKNRDFFEKRFNAWTLTEKKEGHFTEDDGTKTLPQALAALEAMIKNDR